MATETETESQSVPGVVEALYQWERSAATAGLSPRYAAHGVYCVRELADACGWARFSQDVHGDAERFLGTIENPKTRNNHLNHLRKFLRYCKGRGWVAVNWATEIQQARVKTVRKRQAFTQHQVDALVLAARAAEARGQKPRALGYLLAWHCGLRHGEIGRLEWADVRLGADPPHILVRAAKAGEDQTVPIVSGELLAALEAAQQPGGRLFPSGLAHHKQVTRDLAVAGIDRVNRWGEQAAPWHSLRHGFCTRLAQTGVNIQTAQALMRHKTVSMTVRYTSARMLPQIEALKSLENTPAFQGDEKIFCEEVKKPVDRRGDSSDTDSVMTVNHETTRAAQVDARRHDKLFASNARPGQSSETAQVSDSSGKWAIQGSNLYPAGAPQVFELLRREQALTERRLNLLGGLLQGGQHGGMPGRDAHK